MVAFGVILLVVGLGGGALIGWLASQNTTGVTLGGAGLSVSVLPVTLFAAGAVSVALIWLGAGVMRAAARRRRARREEVRRLRDEQARTPAPRPSGTGPGQTH